MATLSLKRLSDKEIIEEIERQTGQTITRNGLYRIKQRIKKQSYQWYTTLAQDRYAYINEFKERINEVMDLQKRCHELIESNKHNPQVQLSAIAELHRLNITLSNYIDVLPDIIGPTISAAPEVKTVPTAAEQEQQQSTIIV